MIEAQTLFRKFPRTFLGVVAKAGASGIQVKRAGAQRWESREKMVLKVPPAGKTVQNNPQCRTVEGEEQRQGHSHPAP